MAEEKQPATPSIWGTITSAADSAKNALLGPSKENPKPPNTAAEQNKGLGQAADAAPKATPGGRRRKGGKHTKRHKKGGKKGKSTRLTRARTGRKSSRL